MLTPVPQFDLLGTLTAAEIAVTGATTATVSRMHACTDSGSPADYTLTLPSPSGNTGKWLGVAMNPGLTKLVTIDAGVGVLIYGDGSGTGSRTRVMWRGESAFLYCDGSNWFKRFGKSIPMTCKLDKAASQSITNSTWTKVLLDTVPTGGDPTGRLANTGSSQIDTVRAGVYQFALNAGYTGDSTSMNPISMGLAKNMPGTFDGSKQPAVAQLSATGGYGSIFAAYVDPAVVVGDQWQLWVYQVSGGTRSLNIHWLAMTEIPTW